MGCGVVLYKALALSSISDRESSARPSTRAARVAGCARRSYGQWLGIGAVRVAEIREAMVAKAVNCSSSKSEASCNESKAE